MLVKDEIHFMLEPISYFFFQNVKNTLIFVIMGHEFCLKETHKF